MNKITVLKLDIAKRRDELIDKKGSGRTMTECAAAYGELTKVELGSVEITDEEIYKYILFTMQGPDESDAALCLWNYIKSLINQ